MSIWSRGLPVFLGLALVAELPFLFIGKTGSRIGLAEGGFPLVGWLVELARLVLRALVTGVVTFAVVEQLRGHRVDLRKMFSVGMHRLWMLFSTSFVTNFGIGLGLLLLIVPGILFAVWWLVVAPVVVVEGLKQEAARSRSKALTEGHRWALLALYLLFFFIALGLLNALKVVVGEDQTLPARLATDTLPRAFVLSLTEVVTSVVYYLLRSEKEGIGLDELAAVFE